MYITSKNYYETSDTLTSGVTGCVDNDFSVLDLIYDLI